MITPHKKPPNGELSEAAEEANKSINKIRQVVERTIAHIKSWRIHPHRLPAPPALKYARDHVYDPPRAAFDSHFDNR